VFHVSIVSSQTTQSKEPLSRPSAATLSLREYTAPQRHVLLGGLALTRAQCLVWPPNGKTKLMSDHTHIIVHALMSTNDTTNVTAIEPMMPSLLEKNTNIS
jgi:hypothetical protein